MLAAVRVVESSTLPRRFQIRDSSASTFQAENIELAKAQAALDQVRNITFIHCGIDDFETPEKFDVITANGVLHHLSDPRQSLQKIVRFLKNDGLFIAWLCHIYGEYRPDTWTKSLVNPARRTKS